MIIRLVFVALLALSCVLYSSYKTGKHLPNIFPIEVTSSTSITESESEDTLCDDIINSFPSKHFVQGSQHRLKPYVKELLSRDAYNTLSPKRNKRSNLRDISQDREETYGSPYNEQELSEQLRTKSLLFHAANKALDQRERDLIDMERRIQQRYSKKMTAALTAGATALTAIASVLVTYFAR